MLLDCYEAVCVVVGFMPIRIFHLQINSVVSKSNLYLLKESNRKFKHDMLCELTLFNSVTIPHKEAAVKCCDEVDPVAKVILIMLWTSYNTLLSLWQYISTL